MSVRINDIVTVFNFKKHGPEDIGRKAKVLDYKWNLILVRFDDGECECEWVDCRLVNKC